MTKSRSRAGLHIQIPEANNDGGQQMWGTAIRMLISDRGKLATALVGVIFSVLLVNFQRGLFIGLIDKAGSLVDNGQSDIWVGHIELT